MADEEAWKQEVTARMQQIGAVISELLKPGESITVVLRSAEHNGLEAVMLGGHGPDDAISALSRAQDQIREAQQQRQREISAPLPHLWGEEQPSLRGNGTFVVCAVCGYTCLKGSRAHAFGVCSGPTPSSS